MKYLLCFIIPLLLFSSCYKDFSVEAQLQATVKPVTDTTITDTTVFYNAVIHGKIAKLFFVGNE